MRHVLNKLAEEHATGFIDRVEASRSGADSLTSGSCNEKAELDADLGVLHRHVQALLGPADLLGG